MTMWNPLRGPLHLKHVRHSEHQVDCISISTSPHVKVYCAGRHWARRGAYVLHQDYATSKLRPPNNSSSLCRDGYLDEYDASRGVWWPGNAGLSCLPKFSIEMQPVLYNILRPGSRIRSSPVRRLPVPLLISGWSSTTARLEMQSLLRTIRKLAISTSHANLC